MKILVLGGTRFVGRHIIQAALKDGHEVTTFNRGSHLSGISKTTEGSDIFPEVEKRIGDRHKDLSALEGRQWDVVIDSSGYAPKSVRACAMALSKSVQTYIYISTGSVYNKPEEGPFTELSSVYEVTQEALDKADTTSVDGSPTAISYGESYGPLKAECERVVEEVMPGRALIVRLGLIVGAYDYTNRFPYWIERIAKGGCVLAPDTPNALIGFIDARDAGDWIVEMAKQYKTGVYNVTGQNNLTFGKYLKACQSVTQSDAKLTWATESFLLEHNVQPWNDLPLWLPTPLLNLFSFDSSKAEREGLKYRSIEETVAETYAWMLAETPKFEIDSAINQEKEKQLLTLWQK